MVNEISSIHFHTEYSNALLGFPDSVNKLEDSILEAYKIGLKGIAITEHEGIMSHVKAIKCLKEVKKKGEISQDFKLILGNEIYLMTEEEDLKNRDNDEDRTPYYHFLLNALDEEGHKQIRLLSDRAWRRAYMYRGLMRRPTYYTDIEEIIGSNKGHIVASTACLGGYLAQHILQWKQNNDLNAKIKVAEFMRWGLKVFGEDNFYLEIQPCNADNEEQIIVNETLDYISQRTGIKLIVTTDAHYLNKDKAFVHKTLLNSKDGDREVDSFYATAYMMGAKELREYLRLTFTDDRIDELFQNTNEIIDRSKFYDFEHAPQIPQLPKGEIPDFKIKHRYKEYYEEFKEFKYYAYINTLEDSYFFYRIEQALYNLVEQKGKNIKDYIARLNDEFRELRLISEAFNDSMASYYVTMSKIVEMIWSLDSLSMCGRGSGAGFLVCYLLEITQIDPVPLGDYFPFWRHLSAERGYSIADIDNDSQGNKRKEIIEAIRDYFGADRVLNVATASTLTGKTAIEKSCKGLGIPDDVAGYLKSLIPVERGNIWSLKDCIYGNEKKKRKKVATLINEINQYEHLLECALDLEELVIGRGTHASGILIGNEPYTNTISSMKAPDGTLCSSYDLHDCEYCGQTKVDILSIDASDKISATIKLLVEHGYMEWQGSLKDTYWKYLHPDVLNYDEPKMWDMIKQICSLFQFDTPVAVKAIDQVNPKSVMELSVTNSLMRLMAQDGQEPPLEKYARYKDNIQNWYNDMTEYGLTQEEQEVLKKHLSKSYGLADSQEKVMLLSMDNKTSGFNLKQSNQLRKSIAKKDEEVLNETEKLFLESCEKQDTSKTMMDYIWNVVFAMSFGYVRMVITCEPY